MRGRIVSVEVVPYESAPWAPRVPGAKWAYRITTIGGNVVTGARRDNRENTKLRADAAAARLAKNYAKYRIAKSGWPTEVRDAG